ncbi:MAG: hypothetical protein L3J41_05150 [Melioribacteraceae bacterium]|nr:hypothetical protein [Melioribacteraceae bacterium]
MKSKIYIIALILFCFIIFEESKAQDKSDSLEYRHAISLAVGDFLDIEYRKRISNNWYFTVNAILLHQLTNESGRLPIGGYDKNLNSEYTMGAKLLALYHSKVYSPIFVNFGGGITYIKNEYYHESQKKETNEKQSYSVINTRYGFSFLSGIEVVVYKSLNVFARFNIFAGLEYYSTPRFIINKYSFEFENLSVGIVIYW